VFTRAHYWGVENIINYKRIFIFIGNRRIKAEIFMFSILTSDFMLQKINFDFTTVANIPNFTFQFTVQETEM
jgi:hypothetical protein